MTIAETRKIRREKLMTQSGLALPIENTRLLNELRERTDEVIKLNQQLEQRVADQVGEIERMSRFATFPPAASR